MFKKNKTPKEEIYQKANSSFDFDYNEVTTHSKESAAQIAFSEAIKHLPQEDPELKEVDYYA